MSSNFKLLAGLLVDVRARQDSIPLDARWQGNRTVNNGPSSLRRIDDFHRTLIQDGVVVRLHADPDDFGTMSRHDGCPPATRFPTCQSTTHASQLPAATEVVASGNHQSYRVLIWASMALDRIFWILRRDLAPRGIVSTYRPSYQPGLKSIACDDSPTPFIHKLQTKELDSRVPRPESFLPFTPIAIARIIPGA